jgi:hypothetical protein
MYRSKEWQAADGPNRYATDKDDQSRWIKGIEGAVTERVVEGGQWMSREELKMVVFWVVAPCSLVEIYQRFRGPEVLAASIIRAISDHLRTCMGLQACIHTYTHKNAHTHTHLYHFKNPTV